MDDDGHVLKQSERARFLLDQDEGNLGNEQIVLPVGITVNPAYPNGVPDAFPPLPASQFQYLQKAGTTGSSDLVRILNMEGMSKFGHVVTLGIAAHGLNPPIGFANPMPPPAELLTVPQGWGPIVVTLEFGQGASATRVQFDVPVGGSPLNQNPDIDSGVIVTVPASITRVYARNDGGLIPTNVFGDLKGNERLDLGEGGPVGVKAFVVNGNRASVGRVGRLLALASYALPTIVSTTYNVPPFAKRVRFLRAPMSAPILFAFLPGFDPAGFALDSGFVPAGTSSPTFEVPSQATAMTVTTLAPGVSKMFADFEIQV